ncbi:F-box only protein 11-like [Haemaphysalis longicornis]
MEGDAQDASASAEMAAGRALEPPCEKRGKRPPQDVERDCWLPEKRQRRAPSSEVILPSGDENTAGSVRLLDIPEEVVVLMLSCLLERDLCRVAKVCRRLNEISNTPTLWKSLYQRALEYNLPLLHPAPDQFYFVFPDEAVIPNAWKERFRRLHRGNHVRPRYQEHIPGWSLTCTDKNVTALNLSRAVNQPVSFVHAGTYQEELITVDSSVALIGAAPGNVAEKVIIQRGKGSTVTFVEGARAAYLGYLTLNFKPRSPSPRRNRKRCCLQIIADCSPRGEHCIVHSTSAVDAAVCVIGQGAEARLHWCAISDCPNAGLCLADYAKGTYEGNDISRNGLGGVWVSNYASPVMRRNRIHHCTGVGLYAFENGMGHFEANDTYDISAAVVEVTLGAEPKVVHREILNGEMSGVVSSRYKIFHVQVVT